MKVRVYLDPMAGPSPQASRQLEFLASLFTRDPVVAKDDELDRFFISATDIDAVSESISNREFFGTIDRTLHCLESIASYKDTKYEFGLLKRSDFLGTQQRGAQLSVSGIVAFSEPAPEADPDISVEDLLKLTRENPRWPRVFELLASPDDQSFWLNLWGVRDILWYGMDAKEWMKEFNRQQFFDFGKNANSREFSGERARHLHDDYVDSSPMDITPQRMSVVGARAYVRSLVNEAIKRTLE